MYAITGSVRGNLGVTYICICYAKIYIAPLNALDNWIFQAKLASLALFALDLMTFFGIMSIIEIVRSLQLYVIERNVGEYLTMIASVVYFV